MVTMGIIPALVALTVILATLVVGELGFGAWALTRPRSTLDRSRP